MSAGFWFFKKLKKPALGMRLQNLTITETGNGNAGFAICPKTHYFGKIFESRFIMRIIFLHWLTSVQNSVYIWCLPIGISMPYPLIHFKATLGYFWIDFD